MSVILFSRPVSSESQLSSASTCLTRYCGRKMSKQGLSRILSTMLPISSRTRSNTHLICYIPILGSFLSSMVILPRNSHLPTAALSVSVYLCVHRRFNIFIFQSLGRYVPAIRSERVRSLQEA